MARKRALSTATGQLPGNTAASELASEAERAVVLEVVVGSALLAGGSEVVDSSEGTSAGSGAASAAGLSSATDAALEAAAAAEVAAAELTAAEVTATQVTETAVAVAGLAGQTDRAVEVAFGADAEVAKVELSRARSNDSEVSGPGVSESVENVPPNFDVTAANAEEKASGEVVAAVGVNGALSAEESGVNEAAPQNTANAEPEQVSVGASSPAVGDAVEADDEDTPSPVNYDDEGLTETLLDETLYRFDAGKQGTAVCLSMRSPGSWKWRFLGELRWDGRTLRSRQLERQLLERLSIALREYSAAAE